MITGQDLVSAALDLGFVQVTYHEQHEVFSCMISFVENGSRRLATNSEMTTIKARAAEMQSP